MPLQVNGPGGSIPSLLLLPKTGTQSIAFEQNECQGCTNPLIQAHDEAITFSNGTQNTGNLVIGNWNSAAAGIRITSNGNVGVGTYNPAEKLDVSGNIRLAGNVTSASTNEFKMTAPAGVPICIGTGC